MQVKHYLSILFLLATLAACQTSPEVVVPESASQAGARVATQVYSNARIENMRNSLIKKLNEKLNRDGERTLALNSKLNEAAQKLADEIGTDSRDMTLNNEDRLLAAGYTVKTSSRLPVVTQLTYKTWGKDKTEALETNPKKYLIYDEYTAESAVRIFYGLSTYKPVVAAPIYKEAGVGFSYSTKLTQYFIILFLATPK
jgi:hypothetical protein